MERVMRCKECGMWVDPEEVFTTTSANGPEFHFRTGAHDSTCGPVAEVVVDQGKPWRWKDEPEKR